jgi:WD40 repeat protein
LPPDFQAAPQPHDADGNLRYPVQFNFTFSGLVRAGDRVQIHFVLAWLLLCLPLCGCSKRVELGASSAHRFTQEQLIDAGFSADGQYSLLLTRRNAIEVWRNTDKSLIRRWPPQQVPQKMQQIRLTGDNQTMIAAGENTIFMWALTSGEPIGAWQFTGKDSLAKISSMAAYANHQSLVVGMTDGSLIDARLQGGANRELALHASDVRHLRLSDDGQRLVSAGNDAKVGYWDLTTGTLLQEFELDFRITSIALDEASSRLFASDALSSQEILDLTSDRAPLPLSYTARFGWFRAAQFSPDSQYLYTGSTKESVSMWQVAQTNPASVQPPGALLLSWPIARYSMGTRVLDMFQGSEGLLQTLSSDGVLETWDPLALLEQRQTE